MAVSYRFLSLLYCVTMVSLEAGRLFSMYLVSEHFYITIGESVWVWLVGVTKLCFINATFVLILCVCEYVFFRFVNLCV